MRIHEYLRDMLVVKYEKRKSCSMRTPTNMYNMQLLLELSLEE
jgi:hypothetical protein